MNNQDNYQNGNSEQNNKTDHNQLYRHHEQGYVYPDHMPDSSQLNQAKPPKKDKTRIVGILALTLALVVLFSAVTGSLVYYYMKSLTPETTQTGQSETNETSEAMPSETNPADQNETDGQDNSSNDENMQPDTSARDRHFSIESAAARRDRNADPLSIVEIAEIGKPAVVAITTEITVRDFFGQVGSVPAAGSGFIISEDGYIITNNHVVENATAITVFLENGNFYDARFVGSDPQNDIAVLKIDDEDLPTVILGDSSDIMVGELAVAIGNPLGQLNGSVTAGIISGQDREMTIEGQTLNLLQTDAAINQGNSGGALFNSFGEVIGINTAKSAGTGIEGLGFAIPINHAKPIVESIIQSGYVTGRPKIGVGTQDLNAQMAEYYSLVEGVYIVSVEPGSAADRAGLRRGDIIIEANGEEALTTAAVNDIKNTLQPGDEMVLTLVRDGETIEVTVVLDEDVPYDVIPATQQQSPEESSVA